MPGNGQNQWTKLAESNSPEAKRTKQRWQERYKAEAYMDMANKHLEGSLELSESQIKVLSMVLDRVAPKLSAVEQTTKNEWDEKSPEELREYVRALISSHPELIRELTLGPVPVETSTKAVQEG